VYCQLGPTGKLCTERQSFFPKIDILNEIKQSLNLKTIDHITFVGDGEPTLNADLGWLISETKKITKIRVAVITNGSLFYRKDVRSELSAADLVMPSLDAPDELTWQRINRGDKNISYDMLLEGLMRFRQKSQSEFWLQVMLVKGVNDSIRQLEELKKKIDLIRPDKVCITTAVRPPTESFVEQPDTERIEFARSLLKSSCSYTKREIGEFITEKFKTAEEAIVSVSGRHPLRLEQAEKIANKYNDDNSLQTMIENKQLIVQNFDGIDYIKPKRNNWNINENKSNIR